MSNNCGVDDWGLGLLLAQRRIARMTSAYVGENKEFERQFLSGELEVELTPQGTLAERLRAGGSGIPAFYTPAGVGTQVADGGLPWRYAGAGRGGPRLARRRRRASSTGATTCSSAASPPTSPWSAPAVATARATCVFDASTRNFNPLAAMAGRITIAEVEQLVQPGEIDPAAVHLPGIFVQRVVALAPEQAADQADRAAHRAPASEEA